MNPTTRSSATTNFLENIVESTTPLYSSSPNNNTDEENPYIDIFPAREILLDVQDNNIVHNFPDDESDVTADDYNDVIDDVRIDYEHYQQLPSSEFRQSSNKMKHNTLFIHPTNGVCEEDEGRKRSFTTIDDVNNDCANMTGYEAAKERYENVLRCEFRRKRSRSFPEYQQPSNHGDNDIINHDDIYKEEEEEEATSQSSWAGKEFDEGGEELPPKKNKLRPLPIRLRRRKISLKLKFRARSENDTPENSEKLHSSVNVVVEKKKKSSFPDLLRWNFQMTKNTKPATDPKTTEVRRLRAETNPY